MTAWDKGAKLLITNNYDINVANYLSDRGFIVLVANRGKGVSSDVQELIAINFNQATGAIYKRGEDLDSKPSSRARQQDRGDGGKDSSQTRRARLASRTEGDSKRLHRDGRSVSDISDTAKPEDSDIKFALILRLFTYED